MRQLLPFALIAFSSASDASGQPDLSFGNNGSLTIQTSDIALGWSEEMTEVIIDRSGRYILAGSREPEDSEGFSDYTATVIRTLSDGSIDRTFGVEGVASLPAPNIIVRRVLEQSDGRLITLSYIQGLTLASICRLSPEGQLDTSFGTGGCRYAPAPLGSISDIALQKDGRIILLGDVALGFPTKRSYALARLTTQGKDDHSFGDASCPQCGVALSSPEIQDALEPESIALDAGGRILVTTRISPQFVFRGAVVQRHLVNGAIDPAFKPHSLDPSALAGGDAFVFSCDATSNSQKKISVICATSNFGNYGLFSGQLLEDGSVDPSYGKSGRNFIGDMGYIDSIWRQTDDRLLVLKLDGLGRIDSLGAFYDKNFGVAGTAKLNSDTSCTVPRPTSVASDNRQILILGNSNIGDQRRPVLCRLDRDGLFNDGLE